MPGRKADKRTVASTSPAAQGPLAIQGMSGPEAATVLLHIACQRAGGAAVAVAGLLSLYDALKLPMPSNVSTTLKRLSDAGLVRRDGVGWQTTPAGDQRARELMTAVDIERLSLDRVPAGSDLFGVRHELVPPDLAPLVWQRPINRLLDRSPFERNILIITRYPRGHNDPIQGAIQEARGAAAAHGLVPYLASDGHVDDGLLGNVGAYLWACSFGVVLVEDRLNTGINQNLLVELGAMLATGRRTCIVKDVTVPALPTDVADRIFRPVDFDTPGAVAQAVHEFANRDLGLRRCADCVPSVHSTSGESALEQDGAA